MNKDEFEAEVLRQGYDIREGGIERNVHRERHAHGFDARLFILEGHLTLVRGAERHTFGPGATCEVPAGTPHEEHTEADGVRYLAARRSTSQAPAAE